MRPRWLLVVGLSVAGPYKTLMAMLAPYLPGVALQFGEEWITAQDQPAPLVVVVPTTGPWGSPVYVKNLDPDIECDWATKERVDFYCWAAALDDKGQPVADLSLHADAVVALRGQLLSALQQQLVQRSTTDDGVQYGGLAFDVANGRWLTMSNARIRYGRCYVLTCVIEIPQAMPQPIQVTLTSIAPIVTSIDQSLTTNTNPNIGGNDGGDLSNSRAS